MIREIVYGDFDLLKTSIDSANLVEILNQKKRPTLPMTGNVGRNKATYPFK
jgi:hypothetical protein